MSKCKHSYHVICDCILFSNTNAQVSISRIGKHSVSFNGILDSQVSMKDTALVLEYRICRDKELYRAIPKLFRKQLLFKLSISPLEGVESPFVTTFPYRFIAE